MQTDTQQIANQTSVVVGLGATGVSCLKYLSGKVNIIACDDNLTVSKQNDLSSRFANVGFVSVPECLEIEGINEVIASPGISNEHPVVARAIHDAVPVVCDIEIFARAETRPVIAITGTNGKSTVVSWLAHLLNAVGKHCALAGNIGIPALDIIEQDYDCCVLELSSFQLERTYSLSPLAALILNISSDHLDRYQNEQAYQIAKERIYRNARVAIINRDAGAFNVPASIKNTISYGLTESREDFGIVETQGRRFLSFKNERLLATDKLPLIGEHNVSNALAVLACASAIGIQPENAVDALLDFQGLPHRTELVAVIDGVRFINDSKATNAGATLAAVNGDLDRIILIAGGDAKQADLVPLGNALKGKLKASVLIGKDAGQLEAIFSPLATCRYAGSIEDAVLQAQSLSESGDTVLLSPACSSLDMFKNYIERGERFKQAVFALQNNMESQV